MLKHFRIIAATTLILHAALISAFKLSFPELNSTSGVTSVTWDPEGSTCSALTVQHRCLPDLYSTTKILVSEQSKTMPIPVDWLVRLIKNGTFHCQTVAQCEDNFPNVATLASIDVYLGSNSKGQATFGSIGPNGESGSSSFSNAFSTSTTVTSSYSPTNSAQTGSTGQAKKTPVGAIVGGTIGGIAALLIAGFLLFCWRRKVRQEESEKERLPIESPEPPPLPTPFLEAVSPTSPTSPNHSSPRSGEGHLVDPETPPPKGRVRALDYTPFEPVEAPGSSVGHPSTSGRTDSASGDEEDTRRQLLHLSTRVMQLEASRGENEPVPPPRYSMGA